MADQGNTLEEFLRKLQELRALAMTSVPSRELSRLRQLPSQMKPLADIVGQQPMTLDETQRRLFPDFGPTPTVDWSSRPPLPFRPSLGTLLAQFAPSLFAFGPSPRVGENIGETFGGGGRQRRKQMPQR